MLKVVCWLQRPYQIPKGEIASRLAGLCTDWPPKYVNRLLFWENWSCVSVHEFHCGCIFWICRTLPVTSAFAQYIEVGYMTCREKADSGSMHRSRHVWISKSRNWKNTKVSLLKYTNREVGHCKDACARTRLCLSFNHMGIEYFGGDLHKSSNRWFKKNYSST